MAIFYLNFSIVLSDSFVDFVLGSLALIMFYFYNLSL